MSQIHGGSLRFPLQVSSLSLVSFHPAVSIHSFGLTEECTTVHSLYQGPDQLALDVQGSLKSSCGCWRWIEQRSEGSVSGYPDVWSDRRFLCFVQKRVLLEVCHLHRYLPLHRSILDRGNQILAHFSRRVSIFLRDNEDLVYFCLVPIH